MTRTRRMLIVLALAPLGACSHVDDMFAPMVTPLHGSVDGIPETFTGSIIEYRYPYPLSWYGSMELVTSSGVKCAGDYGFIDDHERQGMVRCSNGASGPFRFVTTKFGGTAGFGTFGQRYFKFTVGS